MEELKALYFYQYDKIPPETAALAKENWDFHFADKWPKYYKIDSPCTAITLGFCWSNTKEGGNFWNNLENELKNQY